MVNLSELNPGISYQALLQPEDQIPGYNNQDAPLTDTNIVYFFQSPLPMGVLNIKNKNNYLQIDLDDQYYHWSWTSKLWELE